VLNLASQLEADTRGKPKSSLVTARSFSYDETHTSQTTITTALKLWGALVGNRWLIFLEDCNAWLTIKGGNTDCSTRTSKVMGVASKGDLRTMTLNTGLPKGSNSYRQRSNYSTWIVSKAIYNLGNANWKGRVAAPLLFKRTYVSGRDTEEESNVGLKLNKLVKRSYDYPNQIIDRELYSMLTSVSMLSYAYDNIKSKPGNMTPGVTPDTLDGISQEKLEILSNSLRSEKFSFSPSRRILIPKVSGGSPPLSIASPMDKVVQEAMRLILEAIYEPLFKECSHGFRPNKSCHTALKKVSQEFQPVQWVIEGDLAKFFDTISHQKLMHLIEEKITDRRFTKLIWKALGAGYFEFKVYKSNVIGTPQGSIVSPILVNIFLHQLDQFVLSIKESFDKGNRAPRTKSSRYFEYHILKARKAGDNQAMRKLIAQRSLSPSIDFKSEEFKRLTYVRYADDWLIGIRGTHSEAVNILNQVREFCTSIELNLSETKTKLTSLNSETVLFLGTNISRSNHVSFSRMSTTRRLSRNKLGLRFEAPIDRIKKKLTQASFLNKGKSAPKFLWLHNKHDQIILLYNSVLRGYLNYYNFVHNYGRLASYTEFILKQSCAKLLATKFNLGTMAKTYKKFGSSLTGPGGKSLYKPGYKITLKFITKPSPVIGALYQEKTTATLDKLKCSICNSEHKVELHHVRAMKDLNPKISYLDRQMVRINRKRMPLCRICHMMKHRKQETTFDRKNIDLNTEH
jgi:group II intron reverse transcriptase/maturase